MASGIHDYTGMTRSHTRPAQPTAVSTNIHGSLSISQASRLLHHVQMTHRVRMEPNSTDMCLPINSGIELPSEVGRPFHVTSAARTAEARIGSVMVYLCSTNWSLNPHPCRPTAAVMCTEAGQDVFQSIIATPFAAMSDLDTNQTLVIDSTRAFSESLLNRSANAIVPRDRLE
jgi:hypothetical protein